MRFVIKHEIKGRLRVHIVHVIITSFLLAYQIDRNGPQRKDGQSLIGPGKITPNHIKSILVPQAVKQQANGYQEHRDAYI